MNPVGKHSADARSCAEDVVEYSLRGSEVPSKRESEPVRVTGQWGLMLWEMGKLLATVLETRGERAPSVVNITIRQTGLGLSGDRSSLQSAKPVGLWETFRMGFPSQRQKRLDQKNRIHSERRRRQTVASFPARRAVQNGWLRAVSKCPCQKPWA
jgi:hypothetical protein